MGGSIAKRKKQVVKNPGATGTGNGKSLPSLPEPKILKQPASTEDTFEKNLQSLITKRKKQGKRTLRIPK